MPVRDRREIRKKLITVAAAQSGYFTASQALAAGYSYPAQRYHADRGNWIRVDRGLFRLPEWPPGAHEDLIRWTLWSRGRAIISHETALAVHDLGDVNPSRVHLTVPSNFRAKAHGVVLHRGLVPDDALEIHEGFRVTKPLRTIVDVAAADLELDQLAKVVQEALHRGVMTKRSLRARSEEAGERAALRIERALRIAEG